MKTINLGKIFFAVAALTFGVGTSYAEGGSVSAKVEVNAALADQLTIVPTSPVDFGGIFINKTADATVLMDKVGKVTSGQTNFYNNESTTAGTFNVISNPDFSYFLSFSPAVDLASGGNKIKFTPKVYAPDGTTEVDPAGAIAVRIGSTGIDKYTVAGSLLVPMAASAGLYTGMLDVTASWE